VGGNIIEVINWLLTNSYDILIDFEKFHSAQNSIIIPDIIIP